MVSGALLYHNYSDNFSIATYYKKRWKGIFPMYYLAYLYFEMGHIFNTRSIFYRGSFFPYFYTLIGMDGYLLSNVKTYYLIGEWFLGILIILYILFPLVLYCFKRSSLLTFSTSVALYVLFLDKPIINPQPFWSITSCMVSFIFGMTAIKYRSVLLNRWSALIGAVCSIFLSSCSLNVSFDICQHILGMSLFIFMAVAGEWLMKNSLIDKMSTEVSRLSYAIFLMHHQIILKVTSAWNPMPPINIIGLLIFTIVLVLCEAKILTMVTNAVTQKCEALISQVKTILSHNCHRSE